MYNIHSLDAELAVHSCARKKCEERQLERMEMQIVIAR